LVPSGLFARTELVQHDAIKSTGAERFARQIGGCAQFSRWGPVVRISSGSPPLPRVFVLVVAVTKVTILSTLFSLKEEQDYRREKEVAAGVTFVTLFFLKLNLRPPTPNFDGGRFSASLFAAAEIESAPVIERAALAASSALLSRFEPEFA
jgi:hypothetical protein